MSEDRTYNPPPPFADRPAPERLPAIPDREFEDLMGAPVEPASNPGYDAALARALAPVLPTGHAVRKAIPLCTGVLDYFPRALAAVAECSRVGNEQHHPGAPLHWDKSKSTDEADALLRHLTERGKIDTDNVRHTAKVAWRALALLERELEAEQEK